MVSFIIDSVPLAITREKIKQLFNDLYDATVSVRFGPNCINEYGMHYKTAMIHVFTETRELAHFIDQIKKRGSVTFTAERTDYTVRIAETSVLPVTVFRTCMI